MVDPGRVLEQLESEFFAALEACVSDPQPKPVHVLRTSALRIETLSRMAKQRRPADAQLKQKVRRALHALKPLRAAAGPVRDLDVQRLQLAGLLNKLSSTRPDAKQILMSTEARKLREMLEANRDLAAHALVSILAKSKNKPRKALKPLRNEFRSVKWRPLWKEARAIADHCARKLGVASRGSLHSYRKSLKIARYVAEMDQESAAAGRLAKRLKKTLDEIGRWHDWLLLTRLARETLGKSSALAEVMKEERDRCLHSAIGSISRLKQSPEVSAGRKQR